MRARSLGPTCTAEQKRAAPRTSTSSAAYAAKKVAAGYTLVIFPEGTRTKGGILNPLKPGFAAIARMARAPIQLVRIVYDSHLLSKEGLPWWRVPRLPAHITVSLGPCLPAPDPEGSADATTAEIEAWFRA